MTLADFLSSLEQLKAAAISALDAAIDPDALEQARVEYFGMKAGQLRTLQKSLGALGPQERPEAGQRFNQAKAAVQERLDAAKTRLDAAKSAKKPAASFDATLPGRPFRIGHLHPITQTIHRMKEIMGRLGFSVADGPEIEDEWHNFDALNIPASHPARDPLENFYLSVAAPTEGPAAKRKGKKRAGQAESRPLLLRSQTSTVQIRVMETTQPPVRVISLGRVYRPDTADATHYPMFHQIEGLMIDRQVTMADLKAVLRMFAVGYFGEEVPIRFRPSFFPFTEPSVEVDMNWQGGWMEMGGAGMVDPNVLTAVGYDPQEVTGFAFGLGVERVCMRQHGITDIRDFYQNDVRFLQQF